MLITRDELVEAQLNLARILGYKEKRFNFVLKLTNAGGSWMSPTASMHVTDEAGQMIRNLASPYAATFHRIYMINGSYNREICETHGIK